MKKLFFLCLLIPTLAFAFDTTVKGFIALNVFDFQKIQTKNGDNQVGIGVLDLKIFAEQDNMTAAVKLKPDNNLTQSYNLFEEAYTTYRGLPNFKFSVGKQNIRVQNLHWGVIQNTYLDGGSVLGTENSWRKLARESFIGMNYGGRDFGYLNSFWIWGESNEIAFDQKDLPKYNGGPTNITGYNASNVKAFNTSNQIGFANKFELYQFDTWTITNGLVYYKKKLSPNRPSWMVDIGANKETSFFEFWSDLLVGYTSKPQYDMYTTYSKMEYYLQLGAEKSLDEVISLVANTEASYTNAENWFYPTNFVQDGVTYTPSKDYINKSGLKVKALSYKFETGLKYKLSKTSFATLGVLYEKKIASMNGTKGLDYIPGVNNANRNAYEAAGTIAFWF